jgi:hypothetical protein
MLVNPLLVTPLDIGCVAFIGFSSIVFPRYEPHATVCSAFNGSVMVWARIVICDRLAKAPELLNALALS